MKINRNDYFMEIARATAKRSSCDRASVGAIAVKNNRIICTGYNGSLPKMEECDDMGHYLIANHCMRTVHAEMNLICQAAKMGISMEGSVVYTTHQPCFHCLKHMINVGVFKIIFENAYEDLRIPEEYYDFIVVMKYDKSK